MEMEEKNSGSTCERFLGAVRRSLVHSAQFLQMGVLLSNEERDVEGMVSLKKNSSSLLEREKPPLRELNLLKKRKTLSTVTIIISLASFSQFYRSTVFYY